MRNGPAVAMCHLPLGAFAVCVDDDIVMLDAAEKAVNGVGTLVKQQTRKRKRVEASEDSERTDVDPDLVAEYLFLKKRIYSVANTFNSRSEREKGLLGAMLEPLITAS